MLGGDGRGRAGGERQIQRSWGTEQWGAGAALDLAWSSASFFFLFSNSDRRAEEWLKRVSRILECHLLLEKRRRALQAP